MLSSNNEVQILNDAIIDFLTTTINFYNLTPEKIALMGEKTYTKYHKLDEIRLRVQQIILEHYA